MVKYLLSSGNSSAKFWYLGKRRRHRFLKRLFPLVIFLDHNEVICSIIYEGMDSEIFIKKGDYAKDLWGECYEDEVVIYPQPLRMKPFTILHEYTHFLNIKTIDKAWVDAVIDRISGC